MIKIVTMLHKGHKLQASELKTNMREREQRRVRRRSQVVREENTENEQTRKEKEKRQNKLKRDWGGGVLLPPSSQPPAYISGLFSVAIQGCTSQPTLQGGRACSNCLITSEMHAGLLES